MSPARQAWRRAAALPLLLVLAACALVYANALRNGFVFDDIHLVKDNEAIRSFAHVREIFTENLWGVLGRASNYYRPVPPLLYMLTWAVAGPQPWAFHLVNLALHAGASVLVYLVAARLLRESSPAGPAPAAPATLAALLFAVHPLNTEAVTWIAGIMDVAATFFALLSFYLFLRADPGRALGGVRVLSLAAFLVATLCKEPALVLPALILVAEYARRDPPGRSLARAVARALPYVGVAGVYLALRAHALAGLAPVTRAGADAGPAAVLLNAPALFALYLGKLAVPAAQNVLYHVPPVVSLLEPRALLGLAVVAAFAAAAAVAARRDGTVLLSLAFLALPLAPALYLPALSQRTVNAFAERYAYFASVGLALLAGTALLRARAAGGRAWAAAAGAAAIAIVVLGGLTVRRNEVWRDNLTLWSDAVAKSPLSAYAHENLGYALFYAGRPAEGQRELRTALRLDPEIPRSIVARGVQYAGRGLLRKAILEFSVALMFDPQMVEAHYNLGLAYQERGWPDPAIQHYRAALARAPGFADARVNLGTVYAERGDLDAAIEQFQAAVDLRPTDTAARANLDRATRARARQQTEGPGRRPDAPASPPRPGPTAPR